MTVDVIEWDGEFYTPEEWNLYCMDQAVEQLQGELIDVLQVAIARGEELGYSSDEDYRARLAELNRG